VGLRISDRLSVEQLTMKYFIEEHSENPEIAVAICAQESSLGIDAGPRYEKGYHFRHPEFTADQCTSWGIFQIMGFNLEDSVLQRARWGFVDDAEWCKLFDQHFNKLRGSQLDRIRQYNGSGPAAHEYAREVNLNWQILYGSPSSQQPEALVEQSLEASPSPPVTQASLGLPLLALSALLLLRG